MYATMKRQPPTSLKWSIWQLIQQLILIFKIFCGILALLLQHFFRFINYLLLYIITELLYH